MKVEIATQMTNSNGELNTKFFKDADFLNGQEKDALVDFIYKVTNNLELSGKNKSSWQNDDGREIFGTTQYKKLNCWHYHSGPSYCKQKYPVSLTGLVFNPNGDTSSEVIHYQKIDIDTIFIQAFSPKHEPFPTANNLPNPILKRTFEQFEREQFERNVAELEKILSEI